MSIYAPLWTLHLPRGGGTARAGQEYADPLLVLTGEEYERITFAELHERICSALRGDGPRVVLQHLRPDGTVETHFDDGSTLVGRLAP